MRAKKQKSIKCLMRQMKRRQQRKAKVDEAVTTAKNAIDQATNSNGDTAKTNAVNVRSTMQTNGC